MPVSYGDDLEYTKFTTRQYKILGTGRMGMLKAADLYRQASMIQLDEREKAGELLGEARAIVSGVHQDWSGLKDDFASLWLKENRKHWLENPMDRYGAIVHDLEEVRLHLDEGIERLNRGSFLREPSEIRLNIHQAAGQYFTFWLLSGTFPNDDKFGRKPDYLADAGGEGGIRPTPGMTYKAIDGKTYRFSKYNSPHLDRVDLNEYFSRQFKVFAYAYCRLESPVDQKVIAAVGSNDGMEIFLNGERIYEKHISRNLVPDEDKVELDLKAGYNHILLKVENWKYDWGFSFRLPEVEVRNHKQKYKIVN
jgi:hypothetical protein